MKKLIIFTASCTFLMLAVFTSCNSQTSDEKNQKSEVQANQQDNQMVTVYYFHGDRRCTTCKAVGSVSKETVAEHFGDNPNVTYKDVNIDEVENNEIKERLEMSGSGLFIYNGEKKEDLTAVGFQKAVSSPEEFSEKIVLAVNELL
jgi:hypothetical protein